jgi:Ras GTPase-activating-like protein IQGAP2/3
LLECETEIIQLQALLRGFRQRQETSRITNHLQLAEQSVLRFQSRARGVLSRRAIAAELESRHNLDDWAINLQAQVRGTTCRQRWHKQRSTIEAQIPSIVLTQATLRGWLVRKRQKQAAEVLRHMTPVYVAFQAALRGHSSRLRKVQLQQSTAQSGTVSGIIGLQAVLRSTLAQRKRQEEEDIISSHFDLCSISLQAQIRGVLLRKKLRVQVQTLDDSEAHVIALQAVARGVLARRRRLRFERSFDRVQPTVVSLQSLARAKLARRAHQDMQKALSKVEMTSSIGGLQSLLRSRLASKKTLEQKKQLEFVQPDVIGFQALARGVLARRDYNEWLEYLQDEETQAGITFCQQLLRGHLARQRYWSRLNWYHYNVHQVVKVQAIWRGRKQRSQYRKIVSGQDVDVPAIQSFMHLLDDSETDFAEEIQVERLRKKVIENIHTNQSLESQVTELDTKIALILQNRLTFEDLVKVKGLVGNLPAQQEEQSFSLANSDPFSHSATLERASRRKLELYQHLFFLIQTQPKYLARLIRIQTAHDADEQGRRLLQGVVLALYSYGQSRREEYLLLKLLQVCKAIEHSLSPCSSGRILFRTAGNTRTRVDYGICSVSDRFSSGGYGYRACIHPAQTWG